MVTTIRRVGTSIATFSLAELSAELSGPGVAPGIVGAAVAPSSVGDGETVGSGATVGATGGLGDGAAVGALGSTQHSRPKA